MLTKQLSLRIVNCILEKTALHQEDLISANINFPCIYSTMLFKNCETS